VGFEAIDRILRASGGRWSAARAEAVLADVELEGRPVTLLKPLTFMNLSGPAVASAAKARSIPSEEVLVYFDDVALPLGTLRLRERGSDGGHNGLASVIESLGGGDVPRLRIGIGSEDAPEDLAEFVLSPFDADELPVIDAALDRVVEATRAVLTDGMGKAMSRYNRFRRPPESE
jgi:PTH1 family peptidyl-tRNA hydrolase